MEKHFSQKPEVPSCILSQYIQIDKEHVQLANFPDKSVDTVSQFYDSDNFFINWDILKERDNLPPKNVLSMGATYKRYSEMVERYYQIAAYSKFSRRQILLLRFSN